MDWKTIQTVLCTVFGNMLEDTVKTVVPLEGARPFVDGPIGLIHVTGCASRGVDETRIVEAPGLPSGEELLPSQTGNRIVTVQFRAEHIEQCDTGNARNAVERARTRIRRPSSRAALLAASLSVVTIGPMVDLTYDFDGRRRSAAAADFVFNAIVDERDEAITFIEHVELSTDLKDPGGTSYPAPLQLDEVII